MGIFRILASILTDWKGIRSVIYVLYEDCATTLTGLWAVSVGVDNQVRHWKRRGVQSNWQVCGQHTTFGYNATSFQLSEIE